MLISWCHSPNPYRKSSTVASEATRLLNMPKGRLVLTWAGPDSPVPPPATYFAFLTHGCVFSEHSRLLRGLWTWSSLSLESLNFFFYSLGDVSSPIKLNSVRWGLSSHTASLPSLVASFWNCLGLPLWQHGTGLFTCLRWSRRASIREVCRLGDVDGYSPCAPTELCLVQDMSWF